MQMRHPAAASTVPVVLPGMSDADRVHRVLHTIPSPFAKTSQVVPLVLCSCTCGKHPVS